MGAVGNNWTHVYHYLLAWKRKKNWRAPLGQSALPATQRLVLLGSNPSVPFRGKRINWININTQILVRDKIWYYSNRCVILCIFCAPYVCNVVRRHVDSLQCVSRKRAWCKLMILRRRACSQTIFCQRRVLSNLVLRFLNSAAGTRLGSASDVRIAVILLCTMATRCFPIHPILFVPGCCKPRQRDAGPAKAVRAKGKTQCSCVPFL